MGLFILFQYLQLITEVFPAITHSDFGWLSWQKIIGRTSSWGSWTNETSMMGTSQVVKG